MKEKESIKNPKKEIIRKKENVKIEKIEIERNNYNPKGKKTKEHFKKERKH